MKVLLAASAVAALLVSVDAAPPPPLKLSMGTHHGCSVQANGNTYCFGKNTNGALGDGTTTSSSTPVMMTEPIPHFASEPACSTLSTCVSAVDGRVFCSGRGTEGELGNGASANSNVQVQVSGILGATALNAGKEHMCVVASATLNCWGKNANGQLGTGNLVGANVPQGALKTGSVAITDAWQVSAGWKHTCVVTIGGGVFCAGANNVGQTGGAATSNKIVFTALAGYPSNVVRVASGLQHNCMYLSGDTARCWGAGVSGQMGVGNQLNQVVPVTPSIGPGLVAVAAGNSHSCFLRNTGRLRCMGINTAGELGTGDLVSPQTSVINAFDGVGYVSVATGGFATCAAKATGEVFCTGQGTHGQLATGTTPANSGGVVLQALVFPVTEQPTKQPTLAPTEAPTVEPTVAPTKEPTVAPTNMPVTKQPTNMPVTGAPTVEPTLAPTKMPTVAPTKAPTEGPTFTPSVTPTMATLQPTGTIATTCPVRCAMYSGDPHLTRNDILCSGATDPIPVQHCTNVISANLFANSPTWTVEVDQDTSAFGPGSPTAVTDVILRDAGGELRFNGGVFPGSAFGFEVTNEAADSVTVTYPGSDLIVHIDRHTWLAKYTLTLSVCSSEMSSGIAVDGCDVGDQITVDPKLPGRRLIVVPEDPLCAHLADPWKENCNIDMMGLSDGDDIAAVVAQANADSANEPNFVAEVSLK